VSAAVQDSKRLTMRISHRYQLQAAVLTFSIGLTLLIQWPFPHFQALFHGTVKAFSSALESRFERVSVANWAEIRGIIVLGGNPSRLKEAFRLMEAQPQLSVIISGPSEYEIGQVTALAPEIRDRINFERQSISDYHSTYGNAVFSKLMVKPLPGQRWLLLTSAVHMPRAIGAFRKVGFYVEPWPVMDRSEDFATLARVTEHEWLGLMVYWLIGRTTALLPGP
jgi:uncharacterized SAM-binding protein YcdF (DUF218 family)